MGRCPPCADKPAGLFSGFGIRIGSGVDHEQGHGANKANGLPAISVRVRVRSADRQRVLKHQPRGFETQAVIALVRPILFVRPRPAHIGPAHPITTKL